MIRKIPFVVLIEAALEKAEVAMEKRGELKQHRALLQAKLRSIHAMGAGLEPLTEDTEGGNAATIQARLQEVDEEIKKLSLGNDTLEDYP